MCWEKPWISLCSEYMREESTEMFGGVCTDCSNLQGDKSSFRDFGGLEGWRGDLCLEVANGLGLGFVNSSERNFWKSLVLDSARRLHDWFSLLEFEDFRGRFEGGSLG